MKLTKIQEAELKEKRYNTFKMRMTLLKVDAMLRVELPFVMILLVPVAMLLYAFDPRKFPFYMAYVVSVGCYFVHYWLVGMVRRMSDAHLNKLCAGSDSPEKCKDLSAFESEDEKPYRSADDPPLVRSAFGFTNWLRMPKRGAAQMFVAAFHALIFIAYVINYVRFVGTPDPLVVPSNIYWLHVVVTSGGVLMILKNAGYLIESRHILAVLKAFLEFAVAKEGKAVVVEEDPEAAVRDSMEKYRFEGQGKPPAKECRKCVSDMAECVARDVPMVIAPSLKKAELLAKLRRLCDRSPEFARLLNELYDALKSDRTKLEEVQSEFNRILERSPEMVKALKEFGEGPNDTKPPE